MARLLGVIDFGESWTLTWHGQHIDTAEFRRRGRIRADRIAADASGRRRLPRPPAAPHRPQLRRLRIPRPPEGPDPRFAHLALSGAA
jgi:hypothetical protein